MRLSLVSLDQQWQAKETNLERCSDFIKEAKEKGSQLIIFPEMTLTGYSLEVSLIAEEENESRTLKQFGKLALESEIFIIFGACLLDASTRKPRNVFCLARPDGTSEVVYAKVHPFSFVGEDRVLEAGNKLGISTIDCITVGAAVCYDLRFPELYAAMAPRVNAIVTIANWPLQRVQHWKSLLIARAIENQCFMLGVNRTGQDGNGLTYEKSSMAVNPDGIVLEPIWQSKYLDLYEIDPEEVRNFRAIFPTISDKRYSLYIKLFEEIHILNQEGKTTK